ncbi:MAG: DEAD/DEAH box helicase family protein [Roseovarius sp.]|nr:DEAD/DEAH box helicase family protein [Roseovarius sp.]
MPRRFSLAHTFRTSQTNLAIQVHSKNPPALPVARKGKGGRLFRRPQQDHPAATVADFCTAVLIVTDIDPKKDTDIDLARDAVRSAFGNLADADFEEFERGFPSVCFALATGVGKTRLMGAFISYLYMIGKSRNFFVPAPNLTIYEKLLADFQPSSPKYVFRGIEAFAHNAPLIVNAENYEEGRGVRGSDLFGREGAIINIFNVSKINTEARGGNAPGSSGFRNISGKAIFPIFRTSMILSCSWMRRTDIAARPGRGQSRS